MADMEKELDAHSISIKANELLWPLKVIDSHHEYTVRNTHNKIMAILSRYRYYR